MKRHRNYGDIMGTLTLVLYGGDISLSIYLYESLYIYIYMNELYIYTHTSYTYIYISYIITGDIYIYGGFPRFFQNDSCFSLFGVSTTILWDIMERIL